MNSLVDTQIENIRGLEVLRKSRNLLFCGELVKARARNY